jgi:protoporphyrinogen oxidase
MDLIIGAGVTGLSYANFTKNDFLILEENNEPGGYCKTVKQDGFIWDYAGHFLHFRDEVIKDYIFKNIDPSNIIRKDKLTQIYYKESYVDFPFQKNIHQLPQQEFIDCLYDLYFRPELDVHTFKEMLISQFGQSICDKFLFPYNEKLYACDLDELDKDAMGRFFPHANFEEIIQNFKKQNDSSYNTFFLYPKGGSVDYIKSLLKNINIEKIYLNEKVISINLQEKFITTNANRKISYENLITTIPFNKLLVMINLDENIHYYTANKVLVFNLGFDKPSLNRNHWVYFPSKELIFYRVGFYNNIFDSERMSLYVEIGLNAEANEPDSELLLDQVIDDLRKIGIILDHNLISYHYVVLNPAYVHINSKSNEDMRQKMQYLDKFNIYSVGRYGAWKYCSIEDNIIEARELAKKLS